MATPFSGANRPGKIIAIHLNYPSRMAQRGRTPQFPGYFLKPASSIAGSGEAIERPRGTELLAYEGEIALVVGETCRRVSPEEGWSKISGVTAANDWGLYDLRHADKGSNLKNKGGDGFTPLGPWIIPAAEVDPERLRVRTWRNGKLVQEDTTAQLAFPFGRIVADLSQLMTLEAGDVILTGTPAGASVAVPGDVVEVEVDAPGLPGEPCSGRLVTEVVEGPEPMAPFGAQPRVDDAQRVEAWGSYEAAGLQDPRALLDEEMKERISRVAVATVWAQMNKRGIPNCTIDGVRTNKPGRRILGYARTLRFVPKREDLFAEHGGGYNAQKRAIDAVRPDEVVVMEARGETGTGTVGDVLAMRAQFLGAAGIVTDGGVRDSAAVGELDIPVYSAGAHPAVLGRRHVPWETGGTIACGGTAVQPGDIVIGDDDGVVVIPPRLLAEVIEDALEQERQDGWVFERVRAGAAVDGLFPPDAERKAEYEAWKSSQ
ncbi:MAG: fumarylacetoacetate hydrolase family protein [Pseudoclavibacter sp.]|nr:fumarylacetoacetate hydrolase family protein [Pseudoclavibacter sp.]